MRSVEHEPERREQSGDTTDAQAALDRFLAQPPEHGFDDELVKLRTTYHTSRRTLRQFIVHFLFEKEAGASSSISPRRADGSRTKPFFFNGNGRGR